MNKDKTIKLKDWNSDCSRLEETGESLSTYQVAKSLTSENFAALLDEYLNLGGKDFREGKEIGFSCDTPTALCNAWQSASPLGLSWGSLSRNTPMLAMRQPSRLPRRLLRCWRQVNFH